LVFFGSQEAVKKIGPKIGFSLNWSSHPSGISTVKSHPSLINLAVFLNQCNEEINELNVSFDGKLRILDI
jgi:hypothetical protein